MVRGLCIASIAQLAEHVLRKHKVTSSILVGGLPVVADWAVGLEVGFSLRVGEVAGSIPARPLTTFLFFFF